MTLKQFPQFEAEFKSLLLKYGIDAVSYFGFYTENNEPRGVSHICTSPNCLKVYEHMAKTVFDAGYTAMSAIPSAYIVGVRQDIGNGISQDPDKN